MRAADGGRLCVRHRVPLAVSLEGQPIARCNGRTATASIFMDLSGSRTGQSLPGQQELVLTGPTGLGAAMQRLASSFLRAG